MAGLNKVKCKSCSWTGKIILSHLAKSLKCQDMYDMEKMKAARVEKNRETTNYRKRRKTQIQAETSEASGQCIKTCEHCRWKGKDLNKHLGKNKDCEKRYNDDLEECNKNDTTMAHLDEQNKTYWERKEKRIESSKKSYSKRMANKYSKSSFTLMKCHHCDWKGKQLLKHLRENESCHEKYDNDFEECDMNYNTMAHLDVISNIYKDKRKRKKAHSQKLYKEKFTKKYSESTLTLIKCYYCNWKGIELSKHLAKKKTCEEKYDADFDKCYENGLQMSHLDVYCDFSRRRKIIRKKRKQRYLKRYFKKNKEVLKKRAKYYYNNHVSEKKVYDKLRRKMFYIPEDFEGHGPDCFSCKKLNEKDQKKFDCIFCNPMDKRFEVYSDREALNESCISCNGPVRKIEGINRIQCTICGSASCFVCKKAVHKSMDKAHTHFYFPYFHYNPEEGADQFFRPKHHPGWEERSLQKEFCPLKTRWSPVTHSDIDGYWLNSSPLSQQFSGLEHYITNMGWCAGSNMGGTGKHYIYKDRNRIIFCEKCESYHVHCMKKPCHEYPCKYCRQFYICHWRCEKMLPSSTWKEICQICTTFQDNFGHLGKKVSNVKCVSCLISLVPVCNNNI